MDWLWSQFKDFAWGIAMIFWAWVLWQIAGGFISNWRASAAKLCGALALLCAILAVLWTAHLSDKWL